MRLMQALNDKILDKRLRDKRVTEGKLSAAEVETFINSLPDDASNMTTTDEAEGRKDSVTVE